MIFRLTRILSVAVLLSLGIARAESPLSEARSTLEKWVETRQLISRTKSDWQSDKEMIEQTSLLLERELKSLEEQFGKLGTNNTQVEKERLQSEEILKSSDDALEHVRNMASDLERHIVSMAPRLPAPLQDLIRPLLSRVPNDSANTKMPATERMQVVVGILSELDKFNSAVSIFNEKRRNSKGEELAVETVYVGLGAAYFVSESGNFAGTGTAGPNGWNWAPVPEAAASIREVVRIYRNERPAKFVALPAVIR